MAPSKADSSTASACALLTRVGTGLAALQKRDGHKDGAELICRLYDTMLAKVLRRLKRDDSSGGKLLL